MSINDLIIVGGGGHARSSIDVIELVGNYNILGIVDVKSKVGEYVNGYEIIGSDEDLEMLSAKNNMFHIALGQIGSPEKRKSIYNRLVQLNVTLPAIISPRAYVSKTAQIGQGSIVMHDALINSNAVIGNNCIINSKSLIEHDVIVEDNTHIATGAILNGGTRVCENSFIGSGVITKQGSVVATNSFIKANSIHV